MIVDSHTDTPYSWFAYRISFAIYPWTLFPIPFAPLSARKEWFTVWTIPSSQIIYSPTSPKIRETISCGKAIKMRNRTTSDFDGRSFGRFGTKFFEKQKRNEGNRKRGAETRNGRKKSNSIRILRWSLGVEVSDDFRLLT